MAKVKKPRKHRLRSVFLNFWSWLKDNPFKFITFVYFFISSFVVLNKGGFYWFLLSPLLLVIIHFVYFLFTKKRFVRLLRFKNLLVFGYRRTGKDLLLQLYIYLTYSKKYKKIIKKEKLKTENEIKNYFNEKPLYLSLYDYGYGAKIVPINDFELLNKATGKHVSYDEFIKGATIICDKKKEYEGLDFFLGEAHLSLPNTEHNILDKYFTWLPVFISLSGHLYNMNVIINSQEFNRSWIKIRNQQDGYVKAIKTFPHGRSWFSRNRKWFPFINKNIYTRIRFYQEYQSAESNVLPFKALGLTNKAMKEIYLTSGEATKQVYNATHGAIYDFWIKTPLKVIRYDDRFFHERIFNEKAP